MTARQSGRDVNINMSGIPVAGIGGLGLVAVALVMSSYYPQAQWLLVFGAAGGVVVAGIRVALHERRPGDAPNGDSPLILFREEPVHGTVHARRATPRTDLEELAAAG